MEKREYKWFIEDAETGEWFRNTLHLEPTVHTFGKGWDKPPLMSQDYWTKDPLQAFSWFKDKNDCETFIKEALNKKPMRLEYMKIGQYDVPRILIATEHEFVGGKI